MVKQTAGRNQLGGFAPKFAELNDDILFGEVWSREGQLSLKMRSILTVTALVSKGLVDSSFQFHMQRGNGRDLDPSGLLCRVAQRLGGIPGCGGGLQG